jgi:hypothetical protein
MLPREAQPGGVDGDQPIGRTPGDVGAADGAQPIR